jgi:hypothetical protein
VGVHQRQTFTVKTEGELVLLLAAFQHDQDFICGGSRGRNDSGIIVSSIAHTAPQVEQCSNTILSMTTKTSEYLDSQRGFWHRTGMAGSSTVDGVIIGRDLSGCVALGTVTSRGGALVTRLSYIQTCQQRSQR